VPFWISHHFLGILEKYLAAILPEAISWRIIKEWEGGGRLLSVRGVSSVGAICHFSAAAPSISSNGRPA